MICIYAQYIPQSPRPWLLRGAGTWAVVAVHLPSARGGSHALACHLQQRGAIGTGTWYVHPAIDSLCSGWTWAVVLVSPSNHPLCQLPMRAVPGIYQAKSRCATVCVLSEYMQASKLGTHKNLTRNSDSAELSTEVFVHGRVKLGW